MNWRHRKGMHHFRRHAHRFGPWAMAGKFFGSGDVSLALLSLLEDGPRHGYDLMTAIEEKSGGLARPSAGTIYPTLQQLQDEGLVTSTEGDGKRIYQLTDGGRARLAEQHDHINEMWQRAKDEEWGNWSDAMHPDAIEVLKPAFRLMRTAVRSAVRSSDPERADKVREILRRAADDIKALNGG
ncbi:MAG: PadR family transcriptional regulator [Proteobacteria bacterium]|nr:PadR family transcriptional regulator [Pseudomonadota bacterium]MDA1059838.1 PadR family transcriptional regulator [Pseudomonadota bacterium]